MLLILKNCRQLSELSVLEAAELVKMLEEKWGVSSCCAGCNGAVAVQPAAAEPVEEKTEFEWSSKMLAPRRSRSSRSFVS